jgi:single-stranded-DNA-specific exonuclease
MISISGKKWNEKKVNKNSIEKIKQDFNFSDILSKLIVLRNYDVTEINNINHNLKLVNIFKDNSDFNDASEVLKNSIQKNEKICILGDYDVDGSCSTSLLVRYFNHIKQSHFYYIPNREKDGYGASIKILQKLLLKKPKLVIMVDCGSTSIESINFLNLNNIKSIIIDHHDTNKPFPKSNAFINPKKGSSYNKYNYLCATALTYFFLDIVIKKTNSDFKLSNFLIYVLLATVCDVMPLRKVNKIIATNVIKNFNLKDNAAFSFIFNYFDLKKKITIEDLGYLIGPIINSGGRLNCSTYGTELLSSDSQKIIEKKSIKLIKLNNKRKKIEQNILNEIDFEKIKNEKKKVIIYYNNNINEGIIGIIAARLKDHFNKPSIVLTKSNKFLKASARSTSEYNIGDLIKLLLENKIIISGGGHNMAAGFSIKKDNLKLLDDYIQKDYSTKITSTEFLHKYDAEISATAINSRLMNEINKLGPFGNKNLQPVFLIKDVKFIRSKIIKDKHIAVIIKPNIGPSINSICFNSVNTDIGTYLLTYKKKINIIAILSENIWNNKKTIQLNIKDLVSKVN